MKAESPQQAGLRPVAVDIEEVEPAHILANDAREGMRAMGFTDDAIDAWAREFVGRAGAGDVADLRRWIRSEERRHPAGRSLPPDAA
jgi:hypothetical protein